MFTVCPSCTRQFRIYAEHIAAASGQVRCGFCHEQFNALDHLYDEPLSNEKILDEIQSSTENETKSIEPEPQFEIPDRIEPDEQTLDVLISRSNADTEQELKTAIDEIGVTQSIPEEIEDVSAREQTEDFDSEEPTIQRAVFQNKKYDFPEPEPEKILQEPEVKRNWFTTIFWAGATLTALLVIVAQYAWFNRDEVLLEYPQLRPYVKLICQEFDCRIIRSRDPGAIKLINRDVRLHPGFEDTLLVNATIKNEMSVRQPYPKIQLTLFDTAGTLLGYRDFLPADYLDSSIDINEGMPVELPVHFVLEVSGPTAGAVSFEFRFL